MKLKPCPFCGKEEPVKQFTVEELYTDFDTSNCGEAYAVVCDFLNGGCGANSGFGVTKKESIEKWNMRQGKAK